MPQTESDRTVGDDLRLESGRLRGAWMRHDSALLDRYLVGGVEDPRINVQSIISRSFLADALWPDEFTAIIQEEFRFSICLNFILRTLATEPRASRQSLLDALTDGRDTWQKARLPSYLTRAFELLTRGEQMLPDYLSQALAGRLSDEDSGLPGDALSTFEHIWSSVLSHREAKTISVLEPACGSANDYRYLHSFGLSRFLEYRGFDICDTNIANARRRLPAARFDVGDILNIDAADRSYDFVFVHDLFEHLSPDAIERALAEISRVTRKQGCLSFFNMADIPEHIIRPVGPYHWNLLSAAKVRDSLLKAAHDVDVVHLATLLEDNYGCTDHHNHGAYTLIVSFSTE